MKKLQEQPARSSVAKVAMGSSASMQRPALIRARLDGGSRLAFCASNEAAHGLFGRSHQTEIETFLAHPDVLSAAAEAIQTGLDAFLTFTRDGIDYDVCASAMFGPDGHADLAFSLRPTTPAMETMALAHYLTRDTLTELPNLPMFSHRLGAALRQQNSASRVAVVLVNLNRFQTINEGLGFDVANELLMEVGRRLATGLPHTQVVARLGGDEFAALAVGAAPNFAEEVAANIHERLRATLTLAGKVIQLTGSVGIAYAAPDTTEAEELLRNAGIALGRARKEGIGRSVVYHEELKVRAQSGFELEADLRRAINNNELALYYQPVISLRSGEMTGLEALVRWNHHSRGAIAPNEFIPLAEHCGLIVPLGRWALKTAAQQLAKWAEDYPHLPPLVCSVNVSSMQIQESDLADDVRQALWEARIPGNRLSLEVTESALMTNPEVAADLLLDLKSMGVGLSLDDFGTGYSSLSYLNKFPFDTLKIDRSFVCNLGGNAESLKIIHIIAQLAATLGLSVVAEGVETKGQLTELMALGCHAAQGFLFEAPLPADTLATTYFTTTGSRFRLP